MTLVLLRRRTRNARSAEFRAVFAGRLMLSRWTLWLGALASVLILGIVAAGAGAAGPSSPAIAGCAFGSDVPGLSGYLPAAITSAADRYSTGVSAAEGQKARTVFTAAAAAYVYGLPQVTERATVKHFPRNEILSVAALANPSVQTVVAPPQC